jgi:hypothetical protein
MENNFFLVAAVTNACGFFICSIELAFGPAGTAFVDATLPNRLGIFHLQHRAPFPLLLKQVNHRCCG